jgi:hypothetical protein
VKKPLDQRHHELPNGVQVQRDHYSAWLANFVDPVTGLLDRKRGKELWGSLGVETRLVEAWSQAVTTANLKHKTGKGQSPSREDYRSTLGHPPADRVLSSMQNGCRQPCVSGLRADADLPQQGRTVEGKGPLPSPQRDVPETSASTVSHGARP